MDRHDDASSATPLANGVTNRRRRRRSSGDDAILDAMLSELGIPTSDSKKTNKNQTNRNASADDVIELITPPRPPRRTVATAKRVATSEESKTEEDEPGGRPLEDSILDLTTPTPPSSGKRARRPSLRKSRQSIVNLLSPDSSESTKSEDQSQTYGARAESETESRRRNLLAMLEDHVDASEARARSDDEESDEERILRAIAETRTRSNDKDVPSVPATKKRARQEKKKQSPAPPKPAKQVVLAAVAMEKRLAESPIGTAIQTALEGNTYNNKAVPFVLEPAFKSDFNVIQWERRGDGNDQQDQSEDSSRYVIAMHYPAESFLDLVANHGYDALVGAVQWLSEESLNVGRTKKTVAWGSVVLIVEGMDRALIVRSKKGKAKKATQPSETSSTTPPLSITFSDLHQLTFRLFMDTSVHTKFTCDTEATASYVALLTREIIVAAVKQSSQEEFLESVPRVHSFRVLHGSGSTLNQFANTWLRMLQMIPGVSEDRAQSVLDHFPTFQSLLRAYNDPTRSTEEKEELLADKLHGSRLESALSRRIFRVFSGWNERSSI